MKKHISCLFLTGDFLTLRPPSTTIVSYTNSLDPDVMPSNLASHPDPSCLTHSGQIPFLNKYFCYLKI